MSSATPIESLQMQLQELEHALTKFTKSGTASRKVKFPGVTAKGLKLEIAQVKSQLKSLLEAAKAKPYSPTPQFPAAGSHSPFQQSTPEHETAGKGETNSNGMDIDPTWTQNGAIDPALLSSGGPDNSQMPAAQVEKDGLSNILERDDQVQKGEV
ncbi:hypothetical protein HHX47_DHR6000165 [Lentinula edodes]|nr:hypothetical protein HHX47_DHR6000165 [Lentinula edodes]